MGGGRYFGTPFDVPDSVKRWYVRRLIRTEVLLKPDGTEIETPTGIRPDGTGVFDSVADALHHWNEAGQTSTTPRRVLIEVEDDAVHHLGVPDGNSVFPTEIKPDQLLANPAAAPRPPVSPPA